MRPISAVTTPSRSSALSSWSRLPPIATQASRRRARLMFLVVVGAQQESKLYLLEDAAQQAGHPIEDRAVLLVAVNVCEFRSRLVGLQVMLDDSSTSRRGTQAQRALCALSRQ